MPETGAGPCRLCGCREFVAHAFVAGKCVTCGHKHTGPDSSERQRRGGAPGSSSSPPPPWELERLEQAARDDAERAKVDERIRLRAVASETYRMRQSHAGVYTPWYKLVGTPNGFRNEQMGQIWNCCLVRARCCRDFTCEMCGRRHSGYPACCAHQ